MKNKKISTLITVLLLHLPVAFAQPDLAWAYSSGTSVADAGRDVVFDNNGFNYLLEGSYNPPLTLETRITKRDVNGVVQWSKNISSDVTGFSLDIDLSGNVYIVGNFTGTIDFNPGTAVNNLTSAGGKDYFILKLDANGNFAWVKSFGGIGDEEARKVKIDNAGDVLITGRYQNTVDFDPGSGTFNLTAAGSMDVFIHKLTSAGNFVWAKSAGGTGYDGGHTMTVDTNNDIVVAGVFSVTGDFDPGPGTSFHTSNGGFDMFILKLNAGGNYIWSKSIGGTNNDGPASITSGNSNNLYITGSFGGSVDFDPGAGVHQMISAGSPYDCFILKLNTLGEFVWSHSFGVVGGFGYGMKIELDTNENVYTLGGFKGVVDFDPSTNVSTLDSGLGEDYFVLKLDRNGLFKWAINSSSSSTFPRSGNGMAVSENDAVLITGEFFETVDFEFGPGVSELTAIGNRSERFIVLFNQECTPTSISPDETTLADVTGQCSVTTLTAPAATNSCGDALVGTHNITLPITTQGTTVITWSYDDGQGNTSTQTQNVVITDNTAPVANLASLSDVTNQCSVTSLTAPTATDNCAGAITGTTTTTFPITTQGTTVVTWTYNDGHGNTSTQTQNVVITDNTAPVANLASLSDVTNQCSITSLTAPTATDNCAGTITGTTTTTFPITTQGSTIVTWTYNDGHGNSSTQTQNVVITDNTAPVANLASLADITNQCSVTSLTAPTATDNCAGTITGTHNATLPIITSGTTVVTWTYNDGHGNSSTQTQNVIIADNTAPVANTTNLSDVTAQCSVTTLTAPTATDNCAGTITGTHNATLPITTPGTTVVTWTYNDGHGNTTTQTQNVIITLPLATTTVSGLTITAATSGAAYQWINCGNGNTPIAGATAQSFTATSNGTYAVIVTQNGCSATSPCVTISTVGLEDLTKSLFALYPNPNTGTFKVVNELPMSMLITNSAGQTILGRQLESGENTIELLNVESGVYFISATDSNGQVIVQRISIIK